MVKRIKNEELIAFLRVLRRALLMVVGFIEEVAPASVETVYPGFPEVIMSPRDYEEIAKRVTEILEQKKRGK